MGDEMIRCADGTYRHRRTEEEIRRDIEKCRHAGLFTTGKKKWHWHGPMPGFDTEGPDRPAGEAFDAARAPDTP